MIASPRHAGTSADAGRSSAPPVRWVLVAGACTLLGTASQLVAEEPMRLEALIGPGGGEAQPVRDLQASAELAQRGSTSTLINQIRNRLGLTWDELAGIFGVSRRGVHYWASGKPMESKRLPFLLGLLRFVDDVDRGAVDANRLLLRSRVGERTVLEAMGEGEWDELRRACGPGLGRPKIRRPELSADALDALKPLTVDQRMGSEVEETIARPGRLKTARVIRPRRES